ncbi:MAG TPA: hypothetical protein VGI91_04935 [Steroidobacteraceae bacterium]
MEEIETQFEPSGKVFWMLKRDKQFGETVLEIAHQKLRAAKARCERVPVAGQAARDVYKAFCQAIADALAGDGFEYARSRASLTRKSSDTDAHTEQNCG